MGGKKHTLFLGAFYPELEEEFVNLIRAKKDYDPLAPLFVLVGSNLLRLYLQRLLVWKGYDHANIRFLTFVDFARLLAGQPLLAKGFSPLPFLGELIIVSQLTTQLREDSYFFPLRERPGLRKSLLATFQDLWDGGITEIPIKGGRKLEELNSLYQSFRSQITKNFFTESELILQASKYVTSFIDKWECPELIVYGFYDFPEMQRKLLEACAENLKITAFLPFQKNPGFDYALPTREWFKSLAFQEKILKKDFQEQPNSLKILQRDLFREELSGKKAPNDGAVKIIAAAHEVQEVKEIAREILRLAKEGIPFYEMAILLRNAEVYENIIRETFQNLGIPVFFNKGQSLLQTQEGKSVLLLLDLLGSNWPRSLVMEFLTFAPLAWSSFLKEEPSPAYWDLISRQAGIIAGRGEWEEKLALFISRAEGDEEAAAGRKSFKKEAADFLTFLQEFFADLNQFPTQGTWAQMATALVELIKKYWRPGERQAEILEVIQNLANLKELSGEANLGQFKEIIIEGLREKALKEGAFQNRSVCVSEIMPARGLSFRVVFIPGLVERAFPAAARQDPLLLDQERLKINEARGLKWGLPLKGGRLAEEKILFSLAISAAKERLVLSYPRLDPSSGRERIPSFFLLRVGEALLGEIVNYSKLEKLSFYRQIPLSRFAPEDPDQAVDAQEFDLAQIRQALREKDKKRIAYLSQLFPNLARAEKLARLRWGMRLFTEYDGCLLTEQARQNLQAKHYLAERILSATKLEVYATCPFRYFLGEVLKLVCFPSPEEVLRLPPSEKGNLVHEILYRFYQRLLQEDGGTWVKEKLEEYKKALQEEAEQVFAQVEKEELTGLPLLWEIDRQDILRDLQEFFSWDLSRPGDMRPQALEINFGFAQGHPPLKMELTEGVSILFRGRIDRLDFSANRERVGIIDYKTGKLSGREDGFSGGRNLQLPIYLWAAKKIWPEIDLNQSWAEYYCLNRREETKSLLFRGENWEEKEKTLKEIVKTIAKGISAGNFFPAPSKKEDCRFCDFQRVCEHGTDVLFIRKKGDPRAEAFLKMRGIE